MAGALIDSGSKRVKNHIVARAWSEFNPFIPDDAKAKSDKFSKVTN